jgi:hypothetical protein
MKDHRDEFAVEKMCRVFKVSRSGFYSWLNRKPSKREQQREVLSKEIHKSSCPEQRPLRKSEDNHRAQGQGFSGFEAKGCQDNEGKRGQKYDIGEVPGMYH